MPSLGALVNGFNSLDAHIHFEGPRQTSPDAAMLPSMEYRFIRADIDKPDPDVDGRGLLHTRRTFSLPGPNPHARLQPPLEAADSTSATSSKSVACRRYREPYRIRQRITLGGFDDTTEGAVLHWLVESNAPRETPTMIHRSYGPSEPEP